MSDPFTDMLLALKKLADPTKVAEGIAEQSAPYVLEAMKATLSAGTSPDGKPWSERKEGGRAYAHAADKVTVTANGSYIGVVITGPEAFADKGVKGHLPQRKMLPDGGSGVPDGIVIALSKGADDLLRKWSVK